ncbi:FecR family protein [Mucilaginibacter gracilis]|nr:FecR family protein [Mucilaginibacter gracilis]
MTKEEYLLLCEKYLSGNASTEDEELLLSHRDDFNIQDFHNHDEIEDQQLIKQRIFDRIESTRNNNIKKMFPKYRWAVAASVFILFATGLFLFKNTGTQTHTVASVPQKVKPILPGGNKAILTLADGSTIDLNAATNGIIARNGKAAITKKQNGQLIYSQNPTANVVDSKTAYNTVSTPRGGQYEVVLPDGTQVWLNAASSLKYPTQFKGIERHVVLNGEAYFEVAKNKNMPFTIEANNVNIKVLGTHFNVMAYNDETIVKTTLLEGSVLLSNSTNNALLVPGQQANVENSGGKFLVNYVNTDDAVSWKNGYFTFRRENMISIMKKVARWYDVDVTYQNDVSRVSFGGTVSRAKNIEELLNKIELTGSVHFKIEGRRVIVKL